MFYRFISTDTSDSTDRSKNYIMMLLCYINERKIASLKIELIKMSPAFGVLIFTMSEYGILAMR